MAPPRVVLMSCGSYNPPTNLHLRMFEIARDHLHRMGTYEVVGGVISLVHDDYGKDELASSVHRSAMVKLAIASSDWIRLSSWEIRQNSWTKTRHSLQHHQNLLNATLIDSPDINSQVDIEDLDWIPENVRNGSDRSPIQIKLLCGADLLESFGKPGLWVEEDIEAILGQHGLIVITREGSSPNKFIYDSDILSKNMSNINIVTEWIPNEVSSSRIRRALKRSESIRYLTQDSVIDYIYQHGLYDTRITSSTTKFEKSPTSPDNYLHIAPYNSALLTPSPSDITMTTPSPVEIITIDIGETVIKKNNHNSPYFTNNRTLDKLSIAMQDNSNRNTTSSKSSYPGQAKQIITTETGETHIFYEVGSQNDNDTSTNVQSPEDVDLGVKSLSSEKPEITELKLESRATCYQIDASIFLESIEDPSPSDPKSEESKNESTVVEQPTLLTCSITSKSEDEANASKEAAVPELIPDSKEGSATQIDGKYIKSIVNSRKSPNRVRNFEQVVPMLESDEMNSTIGSDSRKLFQGSLDSINQKQTRVDLERAKSKSFELIKSNFSLRKFSSRENLDNPLSPEESVFVTANDEDVDEFCSVCFSREQSIRNVYPLRSANSSPTQDSGECDICGSCDLQGSSSPPGLPQCEVCEICGDAAMEEDVIASSRREPDEVLDARISSHMTPLSLSRRKLRHGRVPLDGRIFDIADEDGDCEGIDEEDEEGEEMKEEKKERVPSTSVEEFSDDSTLNDVEFEIENCGLELDPEEIKRTPIIEELPEESAEAIPPVKPVEPVEPVEPAESEICRINRGSSMINRATESRTEARRRYNSVDNLPSSRVVLAKAPTKEDKPLIVRHSGRIIGSADNIRAPRPSRSISLLRKSADDVGRIKEMNETDESPSRLTRHASEKSHVPADTVKFILNKHGIKIISDKETAL